jgi:antitoxin component YwqK of YwqJK toxin-antitoxin module
LYYKNGELWGIENFLDGKIEGECKLYHKNGQIYQIILYKKYRAMEILSCFDGNGNPLDKGTLKNGNGTINEYDIDGTLIKQVNYVDGREKN